MAGMTKITTIMLQYNQVANLNPLAGLTNLTRLDLAMNVVGDLSPLAGLTKLTELRLEINYIFDVYPLKDLVNLTELILYSNQISDLRFLVENTGLQTDDLVDVSDNPLDAEACSSEIPDLQARGVIVIQDSCP